MPKNIMLETALEYLLLGCSVIPVIPPTKDDDGKDVKKPMVPWTEYQTRLPTEVEVNGWFQQNPRIRIGIVTGVLSNLMVVDCDTDQAHNKFQALLPEGLITPTTKSPHGWHYYFTHHAGIRNLTKIDGMGLDVRAEGGFIMAPPSNSLNGNGYSWVDGQNLLHVPPACLPDAVLDLLLSSTNSINSTAYINTSFSRAGERARVASGVPNNLDFSKGTRDHSLFHLANCLVKGNMPQEEIEYFLMLVAQTLCNPPMDEKVALEKIKSALQRDVRRKGSIAQDVRDFLEVTTGKFRVTDLERAVTTVTKGNNKAILMSLSRLCKEGIIERLQEPGTYRMVEKIESVNIRDVVEEDPQEIWLPFGLDRYVDVYPGNLIIIAGVTNAGKSAVILNMIRKNMDRRKCWYFSTEMNAETIRKRLKKSKHDLSSWNFEIIENWDQSAQTMKPDDLNFCDWIDPGEEPFRVVAKLSEIQARMRKGMAIVAMQKNLNTESAIGGQQTKSKAAIYLTVDPVDINDFTRGHKMKVVKAKAFDGENPNGFECRFKIINGIDFFEMEPWGPGIDEKYRGLVG